MGVRTICRKRKQMQLYVEELKKIFNGIILCFFMKQIGRFFCCHLHMNSFSIYLPDFMNDIGLLKQFLVFTSNSHWKYLLDLIESG